MPKKRRTTERTTGLVVFFLGLGIIWQGRGLSFGSLSGPGPGFFPFLIAGMLIVLSASIFFTSKMRQEGERSFTLSGLGRVGTVFLSLILYYVLFEYLGFLAVSFLLMAFFFVFVAKYAWYKALLGAIISTGLAYLLFEILLKSNLPKGVGGF